MRGIRCPSVGRLVEAFKIIPDEARLVRKLCANVDDPDRLRRIVANKCRVTEAYVSSMYSDPYRLRMWRRTVVLHAVNVIIDGCGVECLGPADPEDGYAPPYKYVNMGDSYVLTLIYKRETDNLYIGNWRSIAERHPNW